jgi:hypothetical protein
MSSVTAVSIGQWWSVIELDGWRPSGASRPPSNQEVALEGMFVVEIFGSPASSVGHFRPGNGGQ